MAINWPTLTTKMSISSSITRTVRLVALELGDGAQNVYADGINNAMAEMSIVYEYLSQSEANTLLTFLKTYSKGQIITIPLLVEDPTGATTANFYITGFSYSREEGGTLTNFEITVKETTAQ